MYHLYLYFRSTINLFATRAFSDLVPATLKTQEDDF